MSDRLMKIFEMNLKDIRKVVLKGELRTFVVGFGYIGASIGGYLANKGLRVAVYDKNPIIMERLTSMSYEIPEKGLSEILKKSVLEGKLSISPDLHQMNEADVIIVTVGTPLEKETPDLKNIKQAFKAIGKHLAKGQLVILKSTVLPGTTEDLVRPTLEKESGLIAGTDFGLVYSPERLAEGRVLSDLESIPLIIGGVNQKSSEVAAQFWNSLFGVKTVIVSSPAVAELTKLASNAWIDLNVALANELAKICDKLKIDVLEAINATNTLAKGSSYVNILSPGTVGGYCLPKDPYFLSYVAHKNRVEIALPKISRKINDEMPGYVFRSLRKLVKSKTKVKVAVLGISFKNNTGDLRNTPVKPIVDLMINEGYEVKLYDPLVDRIEAEKLFGLKLANSVEEAVDNADIVAVLACHDTFRSKLLLNRIKTLAKKGCSVFDGRNSMSRDAVIKSSLSYKGVGR
jgi:UDP-N-acetyl-D-mannosaminuronic acid dehydrogenase